MPDWRKSFIVTVFKGIEDIQEFEKHRGIIKLMSYSMKI